MKRIFSVIAAAIGGGILGGFVASRLARFVPTCGEDCAAEALAMFVCWSGIGVGLFAVFGMVWSKRLSLLSRRGAARLASLAVAFALAGAGAYLFKLERENAYLYSIREMQPTNDFPEVVIARQPMPVFAGEADGVEHPYFTISAWERCVLGYAGGEHRPARTEIACRKGTGWIPKDQEAKLIRVPHEPVHQ